ncbi:MAG TPA: oligogalacturonate lyase family protein [Chloroflexota bacterium]|nr:oligogalacturonate lyase family protein [Chloroflexota bacterium]
MPAGKGQQTHHQRHTLPEAHHGARLVQLTAGDGMHYLPYFYNPHLDAAGERLLYVGDHSGSEQPSTRAAGAQGVRGRGAEQAYVLDVASGTATQLTEAQGRDQHWSPYIRVGIDGIRPQFVAWSQPDWQHALYWEDNALQRVHVETLAEETIYRLRPDVVPQVLHCSAGGWVSFGYIPCEVQERIRKKLAGGGRMEWDDALLERLTRDCGFVVFDLIARRVVTDEHVPFWVNHIQASPANTRVLFCQEGPWQRQRMWLYDVSAATWGPLREQEGGVAIGHEYWLDEATVAYHGTLPDKRGFFGRIDVTTGATTETPSAEGERFYGHYHTSPDGAFVITDGEITSDHVSVARLDAERVTFTPIGRHGWVRSKDQRHHPHPHWHQSGQWITFTGCDAQGTQALLLDVRALTLPD